MEKYGFIYIWRDKKHRKFYVGRHWGHEDDGYICSSPNMRNNFRNRPYDFKRRVVSRVNTKDLLVIEEQKWLNMIKPHECGVKYYNKSLKAKTPSTLGYRHSLETISKIRESNKGRAVPEERRKRIAESVKKTMTLEHRSLLSQKSSGWSHSEDAKKKIAIANKRRVYMPHTEETKKKISDTKKLRHQASSTS